MSATLHTCIDFKLWLYTECIFGLNPKNYSVGNYYPFHLKKNPGLSNIFTLSLTFADQVVNRIVNFYDKISAIEMFPNCMHVKL